MKIKHRRKFDAVDRLYNGFVVKDLTRAEFRKQYIALMDPKGLNKDLRRMVMDRQTKQTLNFMAKERKKEIDRRQV